MVGGETSYDGWGQTGCVMVGGLTSCVTGGARQGVRQLDPNKLSNIQVV